ncbi:MAG: hypothetical protein IPG89_05310 [Bacteroidetes bacterium]|nr:hypothetical protein [Bacteroidota bacterium]
MPNVEAWGTLEQFKRKEVVGFYISGHPLDSFKRVKKAKCKNTTADVSDLAPWVNKELTLAGIITVVENRTSKNGNPWGKFILEDYSGSAEFTLFGNDYVNFRNYLDPNQFVFIRGKAQARYGQPDNLEFKIQKIELLSEMKNNAFTHLQFIMKVTDLNETMLKMDDLLKITKPETALMIFVITDPTKTQAYV